MHLLAGRQLLASWKTTWGDYGVTIHADNLQNHCTQALLRMCKIPCTAQAKLTPFSSSCTLVTSSVDQWQNDRLNQLVPSPLYELVEKTGLQALLSCLKTRKPAPVSSSNHLRTNGDGCDYYGHYEKVQE